MERRTPVDWRERNMRLRSLLVGLLACTCAACGDDDGATTDGGADSDECPEVCWQAVDTGDGVGFFTGISANAPDDVYMSIWNSYQMSHFDGTSVTTINSPEVAPRVVWAAGDGDAFVADSQPGGDIARFDGATWETLRTDVPYFNAVWAQSADDVFAVANSAVSPIWHYDGTTWAPMDLDVGPFQIQLADVWAGSDGTAFAVGTKYGLGESLSLDTATGIVLAYDGATWTEMDLDWLPLGTWLWSIVASPAGDLWAVGGRDDGAFIYRYDGAQWVEVDLSSIGGDDIGVLTMWGSGPDDVYAGVETNDFDDGTFQSLFVHFDGAVWSEVPLGFEVGRVLAVVGTAADEVVALVTDEYGFDHRIIRFDGESGAVIGDESTFTDGFQPYALVAGGAGDVVAGGWSTATADYPDGVISFWSYDGATWTHMVDGYLFWNSFSNTVSVGETDGSLWVADTLGAIWTHDGVGWAESKPANPCPGVNAMWGTGPTDVFAGCAGGKVLHFDGTTWAAMETGTELPIVDLWGSGPADVYATAYRPYVDYDDGLMHGGALMHYDGAAWVDIGGPDVSMRVWGSRADNVFIGGRGTMLHFDGAEWSAEVVHEMSCSISDEEGGYSYPNVEDLWGFEQDGVTELFVVPSWLCPGGCEDGQYLHYDGSSWDAIAVTGHGGAGITAVGGTGPNDIWLAGEDGLLLHYPCE
jgi:hypothetical protein